MAVLGGESHAWVASVTDSSNTFEELAFGEGGREGEECCAESGGEVDLLSETDAGVISDYAEGLVHAAGEVEGAPGEEVAAESVEGCDAVFDGLCAVSTISVG